MFLVYKYILCVEYFCSYRMYIFCNHYMSFSAFYKMNSISYKLIDLVWIDRMYNQSISQSYKPFLQAICAH